MPASLLLQPPGFNLVSPTTLCASMVGTHPLNTTLWPQKEAPYETRKPMKDWWQ